MLRTLKGDKKIETLFDKGFVLKEKNILLKGIKRFEINQMVL